MVKRGRESLPEHRAFERNLFDSVLRFLCRFAASVRYVIYRRRSSKPFSQSYSSGTRMLNLSQGSSTKR